MEPQKLIQSLLKSELLSEASQAEFAEDQHRVITISRQMGANGEAVSHLLADQLGLHYFDKEILDAVAQEAGVQRYLFERLDEQVRGIRSNWLSSLISSKSQLAEKYRHNLINVILSIGGQSGIIVGRGANFILEGLGAFRVRIVAPEPVRVKRIAEKRGIGLKEARALIEEDEQQRSQFVQALFQRSCDDPTAYDLLINSEHFTAEAVASLILIARKQARLRRTGTKNAAAL